MGVWLVRKKRDGMHYVVRTVDKNQIQDSYVATAAELNLFLTAKTQEQILEALTNMPPLTPSKKFADTQRIYTVEEFKDDKYASQFDVCKTEQLEAEFFLDSANGVRANTDSLNGLVKKYGSDGLAVANTMDANDESLVVVVEPILDVTTLRNTLSIVARLLGHLIQDETPDTIFEDCGFVGRYNKTFGIDMYCIPVKLTLGEAVRRSDSHWYTRTKATNIDPFFISMTTLASRQAHYPITTFLPFINKADVLQLAEDNGEVFLTSEVAALEDYRKVFGKNHLTVEQKATYLCVQNTGDQTDMARKTITALIHSFETLGDRYSDNEDEWQFFGWKNDLDAIFDSIGHPQMKAYSYASALMYALAYHPGRQLSICSFCGNAALASTQGMKKAYCSASCRVRDAQRRKAEGK